LTKIPPNAKSEKISVEAINMSDALTEQLHGIRTVRQLQLQISELLTARSIKAALIPTMDELMSAIRATSVKARMFPGLAGSIDGVRYGQNALDAMTDAHNSLHIPSENIGSSELGVYDVFSDLPLDFAIPVSTTILQSLKWGTLAYEGHITLSTAIGRIVLSVGCVGAGSGFGALVGSVVPGIGTVFGALVGGLIGGLTSKAIIEREFLAARAAYLQAITEWTSRVAMSRQQRNRALCKIAKRKERECRHQARTGPTFGWGCFSAIRFTTQVAAYRILNGITRPFHPRALIAKVRKNAASTLATSRAQATAALSQRADWLENQWKECNASMQTAFVQQLTEHANLIVNMGADLEIRKQRVQDALRKLGRLANQ
jgi:hypothetical protein